MSATPSGPADGLVGTDQPVVEAVQITKRFGSTVALADAGIVVRRGETHALVGRNGAGKSTLVSILTGLQAADDGAVAFDGRPAPPLGDRDAWRRRVACVYQKSTIIGSLTVAENLFLNRHARSRAGLIRWSRLRHAAEQLLAEWSVEVDVRQPASTLSVEQRQFVEIARALSFGARFIILDEPTAQLDGAGISRLFTRIRQLREQGVTFLFISHHLQEIYEICDQVTVFRDARHILTAPVAQLNRAALVAAMTGEDVTMPEAEHRPLPADAPVLLSVRDLVTASGAELSVEARAGEVVGVGGWDGRRRRSGAASRQCARRPRRGCRAGAAGPAPRRTGAAAVHRRERHHDRAGPDRPAGSHLAAPA